MNNTQQVCNISILLTTYYRNEEKQWVGKTRIKCFNDDEEHYYSENKYTAETEWEAKLMAIASIPSDILFNEQAIRRN